MCHRSGILHTQISHLFASYKDQMQVVEVFNSSCAITQLFCTSSSAKDYRPMSLSMLDKNNPARQTNITSNLDTDIQPAWPHRRAGRNLIESKGPYSILSSPLFSSSTAPFLLFLLQIHPRNHLETMRGPSIHGSIIGSSTSTLPLLNQKRKVIKGREGESRQGMSSLITFPAAKMEAVRRGKTKSLISSPEFPFASFVLVGVCLLYSFPKPPPLTSHLSLSMDALVDGWMERWMRTRQQNGTSVS